MKYVQCSPAKRMICWGSRNSFSGSETIRNEQCSDKRLRFADIQESCFEAWKRSPLLCGRFVDAQESRFQAANRSDNVNAVIKILWFVDTQESCFEACKRTHMGCSALLCCRYADSQKSRFQDSKRSNMGSSVLDCGRSADIHEFCFQADKLSDMDGVELQGVKFLIVRNGIKCCEKFRY